MRYAFDELNRLIVMNPRDALRPRRVLEGRVSTDAHNHLIYRVDSSADVAGYAGPHTLNLDGTWRLTTNRELALTLHEGNRQERQTVYLKGALSNAEANALIFTLHRSEDGDPDAAQRLPFDSAQGAVPSRVEGRLTLSGRWGADTKNRLTFFAEKADGSEDRLTLQGGWEVGEHQELLYRYRQRVGTRRLLEERTLVIQGTWDITQADRLTYRLAGSDNSAFEFKASLKSPSLLAREGRIVYEVGVGLSRGSLQRQRVELFGTWKLNRDLSVSFEMSAADGRVQVLQLDGVSTLGPRNRIAVALHDRRGERLGLTVVFTRELVPDASLFLRLRQDAEERSAIGGIQVRF